MQRAARAHPRQRRWVHEADRRTALRRGAGGGWLAVAVAATGATHRADHRLGIRERRAGTDRHRLGPRQPHRRHHDLRGLGRDRARDRQGHGCRLRCRLAGEFAVDRTWRQPERGAAPPVDPALAGGAGPAQVHRRKAGLGRPAGRHHPDDPGRRQIRRLPAGDDQRHPVEFRRLGLYRLSLRAGRQPGCAEPRQPEGSEGAGRGAGSAGAGEPVLGLVGLAEGRAGGQPHRL